jgi:PhzF family phenazine biosynthesis protein
VEIMPIRIVQVDAFTNRPFAGNPAAVCVLDAPRPDSWLRDVAREMNLSETAFLTPRNGDYNLRWLTPAVEVDLCGHATVASAHVLWQDGHLAEARQARFHTRTGLLTADRRGEWIELEKTRSIISLRSTLNRPSAACRRIIRLCGNCRCGGSS